MARKYVVAVKGNKKRKASMFQFPTMKGAKGFMDDMTKAGEEVMVAVLKK